MPINVENESVLTLEHIQLLSGSVTQQTLAKFKLKPKVLETLEERRRSIQGAVSQTSSDQFVLSVSSLAAIAGKKNHFDVCIPKNFRIMLVVIYLSGFY